MTVPTTKPGGFGDTPEIPEDPNRWKGWLSEHSQNFDDGVKQLKKELDAAFKAIAGDKETGEDGDPTNPQLLADYQTKLSEYTTYRSLQSNSAKSLADMAKQNARNLG